MLPITAIGITNNNTLVIQQTLTSSEENSQTISQLILPLIKKITNNNLQTIFTAEEKYIKTTEYKIPPENIAHLTTLIQIVKKDPHPVTDLFATMTRNEIITSLENLALAIEIDNVI